MQLVLALPETEPSGAAWLSLAGTARVGYLVRGHTGPDEPELFDYWFRTLDEARSAAEDYGASADAWEPPNPVWRYAPPSSAGNFSCPVCYFAPLDFEPWIGDNPSDEICPSCGTQFGYADGGRLGAARDQRWAELRGRWLASGSLWHSTVDRQPGWWTPSGDAPATFGGA